MYLKSLISLFISWPQLLMYLFDMMVSNNASFHKKIIAWKMRHFNKNQYFLCFLYFLHVLLFVFLIYLLYIFRKRLEYLINVNVIFTRFLVLFFHLVSKKIITKHFINASQINLAHFHKYFQTRLAPICFVIT